MDKNGRDNPDKVMRKIESVETILWGQIALEPNTGGRSPNFMCEYCASEENCPATSCNAPVGVIPPNQNWYANSAITALKVRLPGRMLGITDKALRF